LIDRRDVAPDGGMSAFDELVDDLLDALYPRQIILSLE
jgi:hypothetical protein